VEIKVLKIFCLHFLQLKNKVDSPYEKQRESGHGLLNSASSNGANNTKKMSKRSQRIYELFETEKRFVNILHTIICVN
jgi:hypothetical protein